MSVPYTIAHLPDLPVKEALPQLLTVFDTQNKAVLEAPPGAGKTTLVPLAILQADFCQQGKIIVLEPRRLAARAAAQRMADLLHEPVGQTVGYWVRMEHKVSAATRIEVVTEAILTRMIQEDPALEGIAAIIFDEFHERSLQADLGLALALDVQQVLRPDLRLLIMSATLDATGIGNWLDAPVIRSEGRQYPVETHYLTPSEVAAAGNRAAERLMALVPKTIRRALEQTPTGDILVFLPGIGEIRKIAQQLENSLPKTTDLHLLYGDMPLPKQLEAIQPGSAGRRKVVLSTSIAETSLTIEGVTTVIDGGYARVPVFVQSTGLTTLATQPVSKAAADQRRGRAGRTAPGTCYRLWTLADQQQLPERQAPEICEADLSGLFLELAIWGVKDITDLKWLDLPSKSSMAIAQDLLKRLEAIDEQGAPTNHGKKLPALGLPPRLAHMVMRGHEQQLGATACLLAALLSEKDILRPFENNRSFIQPDLQLRLEIADGNKTQVPGFVKDEHVLRRVREQAQNLQQRLKLKQKLIQPEAAGMLSALAYPDRLAQLEHNGQVRLITGQRAALQTEIFGEAYYYSIAHLEAGYSPRILLAAPITKKELLEQFRNQVEQVQEVSWDPNAERVVARQVSKLGALNLEEAILTKPDPEQVAYVLLQVLKNRGLEKLPWSAEAVRTKQRLAFLHHYFPDTWPDFSDTVLTATIEEWLLPHLSGMRNLEQVSRLDFNEILLSNLSWNQRQEMDQLAPSHLVVPTGSRISVDYTEPATPVLAVRLQEVFGLLDTPTVAGGKVPVLMHLLSPASRPVQVTKDLRSFWSNGYFDVRKDLRGRYPKHHWPEDPLSAEPVRGTKKRPSW